MRHAFRRISIIAVTVSAALFGISQPSATAAQVGPAAVAAPAPAGGEGGIESTASPEGEVTPASHICTFLTKGDNVHISSTAFEASGHGWWVKIDCDATWAVVAVQLQQHYSDGTWRNVGMVGSATVRAGGGAGNRATGRAVPAVPRRAGVASSTWIASATPTTRTNSTRWLGILPAGGDARGRLEHRTR